MTACATACVESMLARRIHVLRITLGPSAERNSVAVNVSGAAAPRTSIVRGRPLASAGPSAKPVMGPCQRVPSAAATVASGTERCQR